MTDQAITEASTTPAPTRAELARDIILWEQVAAAATKRAAEAREQLAQAARDELTKQGTAPSWTIPGVAKIILPVSQPKIRIGDERALVKWATERRPHALETRIRDSDLRALMKQLDSDGEAVFIADDGEVVPGLVFVPGGQPGTLTVRADSAAKAEIGQTAGSIVEAIAAALGEPAVIE
jgi:hypothetical protein